MNPIVWDWVNLTVRWLHLIAGIAWIGSSFYFMALDASLRRRANLPTGVAGESWQVHGGGFYNMQKYMVAPAELPDELHWFKYEAYFTWISGFVLLWIVYYVGAGIYLIDRSVMDLSPAAATAIGVGSLAVGWVIYDQLCKSRLGGNEALLAAVGFVLLVAATWGYPRVFSGRGAYIHAGALIGTIMVANVFLVIIPNQKRVVASLLARERPDPALGKQAKQRSAHNNYLTLPVLFAMISNHYPMTFGHRWNWLIFAGVIVVGGVVRHFFNAWNAGRGALWWPWPVAGAFMALLVLITMQGRDDRGPAVAEAGATAVGFAEVRDVIARRCTVCHASRPSFDGFEAPPAGVVFETAEQIDREAARIHAQAIATDAMPPGNVTEITDDERRLIAAWLASNGAPR